MTFGQIMYTHTYIFWLYLFFVFHNYTLECSVIKFTLASSMDKRIPYKLSELKKKGIKFCNINLFVTFNDVSFKRETELICFLVKTGKWWYITCYPKYWTNMFIFVLFEQIDWVIFSSYSFLKKHVNNIRINYFQNYFK